MKIAEIMSRQPILMTVAFIGFVLLVSNLPAAKCGDNSNSEAQNASPTVSNDDLALRRIFVCRLSFVTTNESLRKYFEQFGEIEEAEVIKDRENNSRGYGFVRMKTAEEAEKALKNSKPIIDGWRVYVKLAQNQENNTYLASTFNSMNLSPQLQHSAPQISQHYRIFTSDKGTFVQPSIILPRSATQTHYRIFETDKGMFYQPGILIPTLAANEIRRKGLWNDKRNDFMPVDVDPSMLIYSTFPTRGQSGMNVQPSQTGIRRPAASHATGSTSHQSIPHPFKIENMSEYHSVNINNNKRQDQQNIAIDNQEDKKVSTLEGKKPSVPESSSKMEARKMSWADMVEEEDKDNQQTKKEKIKANVPQTHISVAISKNEHHPPMESHTHGAAGIKAEHESRKSNYAANEHHKNEVVSDDHKNDEEKKYLKTMEENFPNLKEEANQNNTSSKDNNVNSPIKTDDVPAVPSKISYLNIAKTPQPASKKVPPSIPKTTSKKSKSPIGTGEDDGQRPPTPWSIPWILMDNLLPSNNGKKEEENATKNELQKESEDNRKIFVNHLSYKTTDKTLRKYFQQFGEVEEALVFIDPKTQKICYGFVTMKKAEDAKKALQHDPHPFIDGRELNLEAYEGTKRKNKNFATPSNSLNQLPQLQEMRKIKQNPNIDDQKVKEKLTSNKAAHPNEMDEKHIGGHLSAYHDDNLGKDDVIKLIKSEEITAVPSKKSYLNVAQAPPLMVSKKGTVAHSLPATTSKVGDEDAVKNKNLAYKAKEKIEKNEQENNNRNNFVVLEKNEEDPIKKEEATVGKPRKSYLDAFKTSRLESKKDDMAHLLPESTSKIEKDEENEQASNLAQIETENAASEDSISESFKSALDETEKVVPAYGNSESFKSAQENIPSEDDIYERGNLPNENKIEASKIPEINEKTNAEKKSKTKGIKAASTISEMIANIASPDEGTSDEKLGDSSLHVPIHPSSSKLQGESRGGSKKGIKKKNKKGVAKNVVAKGNETEPWELADLGDSPQILEEKDQKKSTKNKSADAMTSSDVMAIAAKKREAERADERANYLFKSLTQFEYWKFLDFEIALPKTNEEYKRLINDALKHMDMDKEKTSVEIVKLIYKGCQKRRLKYIRLIGAGSLRQQGVPYRYDKEMREKDEAALTLLGYGFIVKYIQQGQIFALYQLALVKRIAELFKVTPAHVTVEDLHFDESEKEFLEGEYGYTTISDDNGTHENLVKIPSQVAEMGPDEVTLIIILNCPIKMTTNLIKSYGEHSKQLILMESSMSDLNAKKHTNIKDKENFHENRRKFQIRKPLPVTFLTKHVFKQNDENDVQICYANLNKN